MFNADSMNNNQDSPLSSDSIRNKKFSNRIHSICIHKTVSNALQAYIPLSRGGFHAHFYANDETNNNLQLLFLLSHFRYPTRPEFIHKIDTKPNERIEKSMYTSERSTDASS